MAPECTFILLNGRNCRCPATRNQLFCHHHAPKPAVPGPPPIPKNRLYSTLARWRALGQNLQWLDSRELPLAVYEILDCLIGKGNDRISDLSAGRYLRALLHRIGEVPFPLPDVEQPAPQPTATSALPSGLASGRKLGPQDFDALVRAFGDSGLVPPHMMPARLRPSPAPMNQSHSRVNQ
jgi:hypothetical protein